MTDVADSPVPPPKQDDASLPLFKRRGAKKSSNIRKRPATPPPASSSEEEYSSQDESGRQIKRRRKNGLAVTTSALNNNNASNLSATKYAADKSATIEVFNDATKQSNWYEEGTKDALSAKQLLGNSSRSRETGDDGGSNGTYRGAKNYQTFIEKNPNAPIRQMGPVKAPTNVRTITVTDFAPDVCKDYKQTGFCGFGDSCKFLHAREDYKQGWELDRDWEIGTKGKKLGGKIIASANRTGNVEDDEEAAEDALLESIPFACFICKEPYKSPIVTKCGHYFCEKCALDKYRKSPACAACGSGTGGVFNGAKNLKRLLEKKRERMRSKKEKAREAGEEVYEDEEDGE